MTNPLTQIDDVLDPLLKAVHSVRRAKEAIPDWLWQQIPLRMPLEALFSAAEEYDRRIGKLKDAGIM